MDECLFVCPLEAGVNEDFLSPGIGKCVQNIYLHLVAVNYVQIIGKVGFAC